MSGTYEPSLLNSWASALCIVISVLLYPVLLFSSDPACTGPLCGRLVMYQLGISFVCFITNVAVTGIVRSEFRDVEKAGRPMIACFIAASIPVCVARWAAGSDTGSKEAFGDLMSVVWPGAVYPLTLLLRILNVVGGERNGDPH